MHEIMSLNLAELWMALNVKEALDKFLDLIEGIKEEGMSDLLSPKMTKAMLRVIRGLISGEKRSSIIRGVSDECDWSERHAARIVDRILRRLEEAGVLTKEKKKPGKQRGRPPAICKLKQYDVGFFRNFLSRDEKLRQKVALVLILTGTFQRFLKLMTRIYLKEEVLNLFIWLCEYASRYMECIKNDVEAIKENCPKIAKEMKNYAEILDRFIDKHFQQILQPVYQQVAQMLQLDPLRAKDGGRA